jgi:group I intron endonuclease
VNDKSYIGSSINLSRRFREYYNHSKISNEKRKFPIHLAILKYGYSNFKLDVLEYCNVSDLTQREQYYIDSIKPYYNILKFAGSNLGFKYSEASRELRSFRQLGLKRKKPINKDVTIRDSINDIKKIRIFSDKTKLKMSNNSHNAISVSLIHNSTGICHEFSSKLKAAEFLGVSDVTIDKYLRKGKMCKGYIIKLSI